MTRRNNLRSLLLLFSLPFLLFPRQQTEAPPLKARKLLIIGSSLAAGWVTSLEERHDFQNGFAQRLARLLADRKIEVINVSEPGNTTADVLKRLERDLIQKKPDMAAVFLSVGNEGLATEPEKAVEKFKKGMTEIIGTLKNAGIRPIVGSGYASQLYTPEQYRLVKETNLWLNTLGVPLINLLGGLEDGKGHFPDELLFDHSHPLNRGHEELFYAVVPSLFTVDRAETALPDSLPERGVVLPRKGLRRDLLSYIPKDLMHSFAVSFSFKTLTDTPLMKITFGDDTWETAVVRGQIVHGIKGSRLQSELSVNDGKWHTVVLSHRHLPGRTTVYLDGMALGNIEERRIPRQFLLGPKGARDLSLRNLLVYRSALNEDEAGRISRGRLWRGSLELFAPLDEPIKPGQTVKNLAGTDAILVARSRRFSEDLELIEEKILHSETERQNEKQFPEKEAIVLPESDSGKYSGVYEIGPGDRVELTFQDGAYHFVDRGQRQEIFPESAERFFIKHPLMEIGIAFSGLQNDRYTKLSMTINGQTRMTAQWVDPAAPPPAPKPTVRKRKKKKSQE